MDPMSDVNRDVWDGRCVATRWLPSRALVTQRKTEGGRTDGGDVVSFQTPYRARQMHGGNRDKCAGKESQWSRSRGKGIEGDWGRQRAQAETSAHQSTEFIPSPLRLATTSYRYSRRFSSSSSSVWIPFLPPMLDLPLLFCPPSQVG